MPPLNKILFLDIETAPLYESPNQMPEDLKNLYMEKCQSTPTQNPPEQTPNSQLEFGGSGLRAEFGKVICVSIGRYADNGFIIHSLAQENEKDLLLQLTKILEKYSQFILCAHNGKGFDFPFLARRYLINEMPIPKTLNFINVKPWDIHHIDTMEIWACGAKSNSSISLKTLCAILGIPSPKDDIDGSQVAEVYYKNKDLPRIVKYCERDVEALAAVYKKILPFI